MKTGEFSIEPDAVVFKIGGRHRRASMTKTVESTDQDRADYYSAEIATSETMRRKHEPRWREAIRAYNNEEDRVDSIETAVLELSNDTMVRSGLPYAMSKTTEAALVANYPAFITKAMRSDAKERAKLARMVLKNKWNCDDRQYLLSKWVLCGRHTGLMISHMVYEGDWTDVEMKQKERQAKIDARADMTSEEAMLDETAQALVDADMQEIEEGQALIGETANHDVAPRNVGVEFVSPFDYVPDPEAKNLVNGVRWEFIRRRARLMDLRANKAYKNTDELRPNMATREGYMRARAEVPEAYQMVEYYIGYDYEDPEFKEDGGAMIVIVPDQHLILYREKNPWGRRPIAVGEWNADISDPDSEMSIYPQTDFDSWKDYWKAFQDIMFRAFRQLQKAPYSTIVLDETSEMTDEQIIAVLANSGPGVVRAALGEKPISQVLMELQTKQVSPEYLNYLRFILEMIRIFEGLSANQLGGGALKSETSATEAAEIGNMSRARLDVKDRAVRRFVVATARNYLAAVFAFHEIPEIIEWVGEDVASEIDADKAKLGSLMDISVSIEAGSMAPEGPQQKMAKLQTFLQALALDPMLQQLQNREWLMDLLSDLLSDWDTGKEPFLDFTDPQAQAFRVLQATTGGAPGGSPPAPVGKSNAEMVPAA